MRRRIAVLLLVLAVSAGCTTRSWSDSAVPGLAQRLLPSVVQTDADKWTGSGVFVRDDLVLTARHIACESGDLKVITVSGVCYPALSTILCEDGNDLALIRVQTAPVEPGIRLSAGVVGEMAIHIGYPLGQGPTIARGIVSRLHADVPQLKARDMLQTDAFISLGSSGGPVFDAQGRLLGVVCGGPVPGLMFCVGAEAIQKFLRDAGVE